jgi:branched-subunit amino acid transport protein
MTDLWILILLMGAVTYIPRMLPMVLFDNVSLPPFLYRFLQFIPFAALGALIVPGIFESTGEHSSALVGMGVSILLAWFRQNIMFVVVGGIMGVFVWEVLLL